MNAPRLGTILLVGVLVAGVALVGPALAHGDATTAPTNETTNETHWNDTANTWTHHASAGDEGSVPAWMASHVSQSDDGWMASHLNQADDGWMSTAMGVDTQDRPDTNHQQMWADGQQTPGEDQQQTWVDGHQQAWNESDQQSHHQQYDDRPGTTMGGHHGHDW